MGSGGHMERRVPDRTERPRARQRCGCHRPETGVTRQITLPTRETPPEPGVLRRVTLATPQRRARQSASRRSGGSGRARSANESHERAHARGRHEGSRCAHAPTDVQQREPTARRHGDECGHGGERSEGGVPRRAAPREPAEDPGAERRGEDRRHEEREALHGAPSGPGRPGVGRRRQTAAARCRAKKSRMISKRCARWIGDPERDSSCDSPGNR